MQGWRGATRGCRRSGGVDAGCEGTQQQLQHISKMVQRTDTDDSGEEEARSAVPKELPACHEKVIDASLRAGQRRIPSIHARTCHGPVTTSCAAAPASCCAKGYVVSCDVRQRRRAIIRRGHGKDKRAKHEKL